MFRTGIAIGVTLQLLIPAIAWADAAGLYGVHYWGYSGSLPIDPVPAQMLDVANQGGWDVEVANTTTATDVWWQPAWFQPLYRELYKQDISIITRLNYNWDETLPRPTLANGSPNPDYTNFASRFVASVNSLKPYAHIWQLGNEPNLNSESTGWPNAQVDPTHYAQIYEQVHAALASASPSPAGPNQLLVAPPSPGPAISGVRWIDGTTWLSQVLTRIPHDQVNGIALHAYGGTLSDFRQGLLGQIAAIDKAGFGDRPLYITEWNRYADPNSAADEAVSAQLVRDVYQFLNRWNQTAGNHNIVSASWFPYDADNQSANQWNGYSIEYWKTHGNPPGSVGDLYTAFQRTARLHYAVGVDGTRPIPATVHILDNFEQDNGHFNTPPGQSATTTGINTSRSSAARDTSDSYSLFASQKLTITDDTSKSGGWLVRHLYNGGNPAASPDQQIPLTGGPQRFVGFFLRTSTPDLSVRMAFDPNGSNAPSDLVASMPESVIADGQWHVYQWNLADPSNFGPFPGTGASGALPLNGYLTINSILINSTADQNAALWLDAVAFNTAGQLENLPEPGPTAALLMAIAVPLLSRRVR